MVVGMGPGIVFLPLDHNLSAARARWPSLGTRDEPLLVTRYSNSGLWAPGRLMPLCCCHDVTVSVPLARCLLFLGSFFVISSAQARWTGSILAVAARSHTRRRSGAAGASVCRLQSCGAAPTSTADAVALAGGVLAWVPSPLVEVNYPTRGPDEATSRAACGRITSDMLASL